MRILVTGVAGLIGSWITDALCAKPEVDQVIGIDDLSGGLMENVNVSRSQKFKFEQTDIGNEWALNEIVAQNRPEIIVHAAACAREGASAFQPVKIVKSNMMISTILLEAGIKYKMKRFVFTSSMAVSGDQTPPFDESMPTAPVDPYGISKAATEKVIEALSKAHGYDYVIIRPHNCFSERQIINDLYRNCIGIFMNRIMRREPIYIFGEGHKRAFSYMEDCTPAMVKAILTDKVKNQAVFIGGKEEITIDTVAEEVIANFSEFPKPEIIRVPARPLEVKDAYCSIEKSVKLLGYSEPIGWKKGIAKMAEWAKKKGGQAWRVDKLPLANADLPIPWRDLR